MTGAPKSIAIPFAVACIGIASFTLMDAFMKGLSLSIGAYNATLWRTLAGAAMGGTIFLIRRHAWPAMSTMRLHFLRGGIVSVMAVLWFWAIARVPLAEAIALSFIAPLIAAYLASLLLGEKVRAQALIGSVLGLSGVALMLVARATGRYDADVLAGMAAVLASAVLYAFNLVLMRKQAQIASPVEVGFFQNLTTGLFLLLAAPFFAVLPPLAEAPEILASAALALLSLMLLSWAYARAEAQSLVVVEYTGFGWGALFGWLFFQEAIGWWVLAGTALIVIGCYIAVRPPRRPQELSLEASL
ncbi:DMT family transporter [Sphingomonas sp.]|jgi:S-adenosylmethionine uptake transporter|uniref:DMT family transporter n=1 Tax=Sphingomonas sp. TaxID=28214 RepID=UPI002DF4A962|nr:DMT family transporter [Sphingomonas sp.]